MNYEPTEADDEDVSHIARQGFRAALDAFFGRVPSALCGFVLAGSEDGSDPGPGAPVCGKCAAIAGWPQREAS